MKKFFQGIYQYLQGIGKALMMPIAVLPAAALLTGIARWIDPQVLDPGVHNQIANILLMAGTALLDNMPILFAIGIAYGLSKDKNGGAALTALVMWLVVQKLLAVSGDVNPIASYSFVHVDQNGLAAFQHINNQFIGILVGCFSAGVYNKTKHIELPAALSFFSGRRLSLIMGSVVGVIVSPLLLFVWPAVYSGLVGFGENLVNLGAVGAGIYGFFNRLLIPIGLHHALNSVFWFDVAGINDIANFQKGVAGHGKYIVGMYQAGFFPIMMFGVPGAALAIWKQARPQQRKRIGSIMLAGAVAAFFTGVTEPIEFSFMFVAFPLYVLHAALTGVSLFLAAFFNWISGFGFSAGLVDFVLGFSSKAQHNSLMLIVLGLIYFVIYYLVFTFVIKKFNLLTPGRNPEEDNLDENAVEDEGTGSKYDTMANKIMTIIGKDNLEEIDNCATRLRLKVKDSKIIDETKLKQAGARGVMKPTDQSIQVIIGPEVEFVADALKKQ